MSQVLHIFRKDTRRFWLEIAASIAALAIYVVTYPARWNVAYPSPMQQFNDNSMIFIVAVAWWLLITRVIHAEGLVGENHFWLTRPYEWKKLAAAKALFVGVWIYVPFVIAQMLVLAETGFSPLGRSSGWLLMLTFYSGAFIVPLIAMAVVTVSFARMSVAVFGSCLAAIACYFWIVNRTGGTAPVFSQGVGTLVPYSHTFLLVVLAAVGGVATILLQYATRKVWLARALAIGVAVLVAGGAVVLSDMPQREIEHQYPAASSGAASELQLALAPSHSNQLLAVVRPYEVFIALPLDLSGVPEGSAVGLDNMQFSMDAADGSHWTGPWRQLHTTPFLPGTHAPSLPFRLSRKDYERFKTLPVTLHVALAVTELRAGAQTTATISNPTFAVPGFGVCSSDWRSGQDNFLLCRSEFGDLPLTYITAAFSDAPCSGPQPQPSDVRSFGEWAGTEYTDPIDVASSPVHMTYIASAAFDSRGLGHGTSGLALCPDMSAHFTHYDVVRRSRAYLTIPNFQLPLPEPPRDRQFVKPN
jgi:hypothetical protein